MADFDVAWTIEQITDSVTPTFNSSGFNVGCMYIGGVKSLRRRTVWKFDVSPYASYTLTAAKLRGNIATLFGATGFLCHLRRVAEAFTTGLTWNTKDGTNAWTNVGPSTPTSAVDTSPTKIDFYSPTATGEQDVVTGLLAMVNDALTSRSGLLLLVMNADNESPGSDAMFAGEAVLSQPTLVLTGSAPSGVGRSSAQLIM